MPKDILPFLLAFRFENNIDVKVGPLHNLANWLANDTFLWCIGIKFWHALLAMNCCFYMHALVGCAQQLCFNTRVSGEKPMQVFERTEESTLMPVPSEIRD